LYLKGRYSWNKRTADELETAVSYFNQAIAKDPGYALAYAGLADAYVVLPSYGGISTDNYPRAKAAALRALDLDASLAHPHAVLAAAKMDYDWDFAGGEAEYKKAFALDPDDATAHQWFAQNIGYIGGREQEALAEINRAHQLDPLSPIISTVIGDIHIMARRYDDAIAVCKKVANENETFAQAHDCLARAYWGKRMYPQVIEEFKTYARISGDKDQEAVVFASALEQGFHSAGWKGALIEGVELPQTKSEAGYWSPLHIATLCADLGNKDEAFRWLNIAVQQRDYGLLALKTDFLLDPIRSDPRFAQLVQKVGLPQ